MVSRNWSRSTLGPGAATEMLEDAMVKDHTGTFCSGERVELAVTMENKAKVSRVGGGSPGSRQVASSSPALLCCPSLPPQAKRIVREKPSRARSQYGAEGSPGEGLGRGSSVQVGGHRHGFCTEGTSSRRDGNMNGGGESPFRGG